MGLCGVKFDTLLSRPFWPFTSRNPRHLNDGTCPNVMEYGFVKDTLPFNYTVTGGIKGNGGRAGQPIRMMSQGDPNDQPADPPPLPVNAPSDSPIPPVEVSVPPTPVPPALPNMDMPPSMPAMDTKPEPQSHPPANDPPFSSSSPLPVEPAQVTAPLPPPPGAIGQPAAPVPPGLATFANLGNIANLGELTSADPPDFRAMDTPSNFWFCESCAGWWARSQTPYCRALMDEQSEWARTHRTAKGYNYHTCEECQGHRHDLFIVVDGQKLRRAYFEHDHWDEHGEWLYVGGIVVTHELPDQRPIMEGKLVPLFATPTPGISHFYLWNFEPVWHMAMRARKIQEEQELGPPRFRVSCQPPAKIQKKDENDSDPETVPAEFSPPQNAPSQNSTKPTDIRTLGGPMVPVAAGGSTEREALQQGLQAPAPSCLHRLDLSSCSTSTHSHSLLSLTTASSSSSRALVVARVPCEGGPDPSLRAPRFGSVAFGYGQNISPIFSPPAKLPGLDLRTVMTPDHPLNTRATLPPCSANSKSYTAAYIGPNKPPPCQLAPPRGLCERGIITSPTRSCQMGEAQNIQNIWTPPSSGPSSGKAQLEFGSHEGCQAGTLPKMDGSCETLINWVIGNQTPDEPRPSRTTPSLPTVILPHAALAASAGLPAAASPMAASSVDMGARTMDGPCPNPSPPPSSFPHAPPLSCGTSDEKNEEKNATAEKNEGLQRQNAFVEKMKKCQKKMHQTKKMQQAKKMQRQKKMWLQRIPDIVSVFLRIYHQNLPPRIHMFLMIVNNLWNTSRQIWHPVQVDNIGPFLGTIGSAKIVMDFGWICVQTTFTGGKNSRHGAESAIFLWGIKKFCVVRCVKEYVLCGPQKMAMGTGNMQLKPQDSFLMAI